MNNANPNESNSSEDKVLIFWQQIAARVRETTDPEHQEEHDKFWNSVFDDYKAKTNKISE
jgi:hypothetical protein